MDILTPIPLPSDLMAALSASFVIHQLQGVQDPDALIRAVAPGIRAIVSSTGILSDGRVFPFDAAFLSRFPNLEIVANLGVGYDNVDAAWAARNGVIVTNTPDVLTDEVADFAMGLLIATVRELPQADRHLRDGRWLQSPYRLTPTLRGRTLGVIGLGRIGGAIARRAEAFGLKVAYHGRRRQSQAPYAYYDTVLDLAHACDTLVVAAPGGQGTRHIINEGVMRALGPDGVLINIARGSLVDEKALIRVLKEGAILAAGLDVFDDEPHVPPELAALDNVVLTPHVGSASTRTRAAMSQLVVENLTSWASGRGPVTPVAETPWP